jgi:hypothetical protein
MSPATRKPRWALLAAGLMISAGVGSALGRAYEAHVEAQPAEPSPEGSEALRAEALELEREPEASLPEVSPERRAEVAERLGKPARTGQAALRQRMPLPPQADPLISIGDQLDAHGVPMNLAAFETSMRAEDVLAFYARHFQAKGWPYSNVPSARNLVPYPRLSATLLEEELQLTVMVMPYGDEPGGTVVLGLADMKAVHEGSAREDAGDLPVYPGTHPVAVRARDEGLSALTVSFDTADAPPVVEDFYRKALAQRGYTELANTQEPNLEAEGPRTLHFASRKGQSWSLALSARDKGTAVTAHSTGHPEATP